MATQRKEQAVDVFGSPSSVERHAALGFRLAPLTLVEIVAEEGSAISAYAGGALAARHCLQAHASTRCRLTKVGCSKASTVLKLYRTMRPGPLAYRNDGTTSPARTRSNAGRRLLAVLRVRCALFHGQDSAQPHSRAVDAFQLYHALRKICYLCTQCVLLLVYSYLCVVCVCRFSKLDSPIARPASSPLPPPRCSSPVANANVVDGAEGRPRPPCDLRSHSIQS